MKSVPTMLWTRQHTLFVPDNIPKYDIVLNMYANISSPQNLEEFTNDDQEIETGLEDLDYESEDNSTIFSWSQASISSDTSNTKDEII